MRKFIKTTLLLITVITISSCEKKATEMDFEKRVLTEIFPSLVDSICVDSREMLPPPPVGELIFDKSGHFVGTDTTQATKEQKIKYKEWKIERDQLEKDTSTVIIAFDPFLKKREKLIDEAKIYFPNIDIYKTKNEEESKFRFDFEKIKLNNKFKLKNIFEFSKDDIFEINYEFVFSGIVSFSRIQFDKDKKNGILEAGFVCGRLCGHGFIIHIKNIKNKWVIDKIQGTWIS
jgi:hypothetical protein